MPAQRGLIFLSYQASEMKLNKKSIASAKTSRLFFVEVICFPLSIRVSTKYQVKARIGAFSRCQFSFSTLERGRPAVSCFLLSPEWGGLFKKEGAAFFFGKFAPRLEREAESQGQKRGGGSPKLQACRNLGKPLFCSYYP